MLFEARYFRKTSEGFEVEVFEATSETAAYNEAARRAKENWACHFNVSVSDGDTKEFEPVDPRKRR